MLVSGSLLPEISSEHFVDPKLPAFFVDPSGFPRFRARGTRPRYPRTTWGFGAPSLTYQSRLVSK